MGDITLGIILEYMDGVSFSCFKGGKKLSYYAVCTLTLSQSHVQGFAAHSYIYRDTPQVTQTPRKGQESGWVEAKHKVT